MIYDAVVVGARCAGSPLARFLAQAGKRVVLVDAAQFPSDQPMSTHFIHPFGVRILDELGLGDEIRKISPPVTSFVQALEHHTATFVPALGGLCPRRTDLDNILLEGARAAGAEVRLGERVVELIREANRVCGVVCERPDGTRHELRAQVVVGADGRNSTIADLVGAEKYYAYEGPRAAYWAYWPRPASYDGAPYHGTTFIRFTGPYFQFVFPTNADQLIIGVGLPRSEVASWKADLHASLVARLRTDEHIGPLVETAPLSKPLGLVKLEYFFRRAAGPGWALVGDAGLFKDPTPGLGITDALRDAKALSRAILEGGDIALERYWRQRDLESYELFEFAKDMGALEYNNTLNQMVFERAGRDGVINKQLIRVFEREVSPYEALRPAQVLGIVGKALLRGKLSALKPFFRAARRQAQVKKELARRRALLVPALPAAALEQERATT